MLFSMLLACTPVAPSVPTSQVVPITQSWVGEGGVVRGCSFIRGDIYYCDVVTAAGCEVQLSCTSLSNSCLRGAVVCPGSSK